MDLCNPCAGATKHMQSDGLALRAASRWDDANYWLAKPGRVGFAALNRESVPCSASGLPDEQLAELVNSTVG